MCLCMFLCIPSILTVLIAPSMELVAAMRSCVAVFHAFWLGWRFLATKRLTCEHTIRISIPYPKRLMDN